MAEKPKTYPQQIQELKQQLEDAITDKHEAERQASFIPELHQEIADLKDKLAANQNQATQNVRTDKAVLNDLEQRAVSAEQGLRNVQAANNQLKAQIQELESALQLASARENLSAGLVEKVKSLTEDLNKANARVVTINQFLRDKDAEVQSNLDSVQNELRTLRMQNQALSRLVNELRSTIQQAPDVLAQLRIVAGL